MCYVKCEPQTVIKTCHFRIPFCLLCIYLNSFWGGEVYFVTKKKKRQTINIDLV